MRDCPTVEGSSIPLIMHRVSNADCMSRQSCNYHKCHRCIYRGQAEDWQPDEARLARLTAAMTAVAAREVPSHPVELPRPERAPRARPARPDAPPLEVVGGPSRRRASQPSPAF